MSSTKRSTKAPASAVKIPCRYCNALFGKQGLATHEKACSKNQAGAKRDAALSMLHLLNSRQRRQNHLAHIESFTSSSDESDADDEGGPDLLDIDDVMDLEQQSNTNPFASASGVVQQSDYELDDIRTEYHPATQRPPKIQHFSDYRGDTEEINEGPPVDEQPWKPFPTRIDFDLAELILEAALKEQEVKSLYDIVNRIVAGEHPRIQSAQDYTKTWKKATNDRAPFTKTPFTETFQGCEYNFTVHHMDIWAWVEELLDDPTLAPHFVWDARKLFKWNGDKFERFINEPWTADTFFKIQTGLGPDGRPIGLIIYADKSKLSSFGTVQGYPVVVRLANLTDDIRNANEGVGGGRIIGLLPIVKGDPLYENTKAWADFKRTVWHRAVGIILECLKGKAESGHPFVTATGHAVTLYPFVLILSADYEEQCMMALTRGIKGYMPCNMCLVPWDKLYSTTVFPPRTIRQLRVLTAKGSKHCKDYGFRFMKDLKASVLESFPLVHLHDSYRALSFDRLHTHNAGLGAAIVEEIKKRITAIENRGHRGLGKLVDVQMSLSPRWRDLNHFDEIMLVSFNDGSKHEDIAKQLLFATHNCITKSEDETGYLLLRCFRQYLELDMYTLLWNHTETTMTVGGQASDNLMSLMAAYEDANGKGFSSMIKAHLHRHAFEDILAKGASRNYNTKPNEKIHGARLRDIYHDRTNFKNVEEQILKVNAQLNTSTYIRAQIDYLDRKTLEARERLQESQDCQEQIAREQRQPLAGLEQSLPRSSSRTVFAGHVSAHGRDGKGGGRTTVLSVQAQSSQDPAFTSFQQKLSRFLRSFLPAYYDNADQFRGVQLQDEIMRFNSIKIRYENTVDWRESTDFLKCSPSFNHRPRYDAVLVQGQDELYFARLILVFQYTFTVAQQRHSVLLALIHPYTAALSTRNATRDADLHFYRVRALPRQSAQIIPLRSLVRGAALVRDFSLHRPTAGEIRASSDVRVEEDDFSEQREYLINDLVDGDYFLRMQMIKYVGKR